VQLIFRKLCQLTAVLEAGSDEQGQELQASFWSHFWTKQVILFVQEWLQQASFTQGQ
jgi:hypothetical protein